MIDYRGHMKKYLFVKNQIVMSGLLFCGFAPMLYAATEQTQQIVVLPKIQVIGSQEDSISKIPGAAVIVSQEQIQQFTPNSTEEILKRVSGVYGVYLLEMVVITIHVFNVWIALKFLRDLLRCVMDL